MTIEDPTITDPAERLRRFGQRDHVRRYGPDYLDRLTDAGFAVDNIPAERLSANADRLGIAGEMVTVCRRSGA